MATSAKWEVGAFNSSMTGVSTSLGIDTSALTIVSTVQATGLFLFADILVDMDSDTSFTPGDVILDVYILRTLDSKEEDAEATAAPILPPDAKVGSIIAITAGPVQGIIRMVDLPPYEFKFLVHNRHSAVLSAFTIGYLPYRYQSV